VISHVSSGGNGQQTPLTVSRRPGGLAVITVACELDMLTVPAFEQVLAEQARTGPGALIIDLSQCHFMGSSGLAALVEAHDRGRRGGSPLALAGMTRSVARGMEITGLNSVFALYPSAEAAVAALCEGRSPETQAP